MGRPASKRICPVCKQPGLKRNGTRNGKVRWRCTKCTASHTKVRPDITRNADFEVFLAYVLGKDSQAEVDGTTTGRTFRRRIKWCWDVPVPKPQATGEIYEQLFLDGKRMPYGWMLLTAVNQEGHVVAWQWAAGETAAAYESLLRGLAPPVVVTVDGASGGLRAIKRLWEEDGTRVQRCLIHVHRNNIEDLTKNPKTAAGKELKSLSAALLRITTTKEASAWEQALQDFYSRYANYLKERTLAKDDPETARIKNRTWWYTHGRDRRVYMRLARLVGQGVLFTYLTASPNGQILHSTTNVVESLNARIDELLRLHRGLSEAHVIQAVQWLLYQHTENPLPPKQVLKNWEEDGKPKARVIPRKPRRPQRHGPKQYDNHTTAEEGLWARKGWGGRWQP